MLSCHFRSLERIMGSPKWRNSFLEEKTSVWTKTTGDAAWGKKPSHVLSRLFSQQLHIYKDNFTKPSFAPFECFDITRCSLWETNAFLMRFAAALRLTRVCTCSCRHSGLFVPTEGHVLCRTLTVKKKTHKRLSFAWFVFFPPSPLSPHRPCLPLVQKQMARAAAAPALPKNPSTPPKNKPVVTKITQQLIVAVAVKQPQKDILLEICGHLRYPCMLTSLT